MKQVIDAMKTNTSCKNLSMANIEMPDSVAKVKIKKDFNNFLKKF